MDETLFNNNLFNGEMNSLDMTEFYENYENGFEVYKTNGEQVCVHISNITIFHRHVDIIVNKCGRNSIKHRYPYWKKKRIP